MKYVRCKAIDYAKTWWNKRNPSFFNFDKLGGDCTNFVSQCLFAGEVQMNFFKNGWFYLSADSRSPSWTGVEEFFSFGRSNNSDFGVRIKEVSKQELEIGDVIQIQQKDRFNHSLLITKIVGENIFVACHSGDAFDKPFSDYFYKKVRFLKVLN